MNDRTLRRRIIRLAYERPDLRPHLLPLVKAGAGEPPEVTFRGRPLVLEPWTGWYHGPSIPHSGKGKGMVTDVWGVKDDPRLDRLDPQGQVDLYDKWLRGKVGRGKPLAWFWDPKRQRVLVEVKYRAYS